VSQSTIVSASSRTTVVVVAVAVVVVAVVLVVVVLVVVVLVADALGAVSVPTGEVAHEETSAPIISHQGAEGRRIADLPV
jgi:hypothetical protein